MGTDDNVLVAVRVARGDYLAALRINEPPAVMAECAERLAAAERAVAEAHRTEVPA
jgi:hypothetical protein